jgi:hypothetical protein
MAVLVFFHQHSIEQKNKKTHRIEYNIHICLPELTSIVRFALSIILAARRISSVSIFKIDIE